LLIETDWEIATYRDSSRNIQLSDGFLWNIVQILHQSPKRVSMSSHNNSLSSSDAWCDVTLPKWQHSVQGGLNVNNEKKKKKRREKRTFQILIHTLRLSVLTAAASAMPAYLGILEGQ
jgi:hypothetical protein